MICVYSLCSRFFTGMIDAKKLKNNSMEYCACRKKNVILHRFCTVMWLEQALF